MRRAPTYRRKVSIEVSRHCAAVEIVTHFFVASLRIKALILRLATKKWVTISTAAQCLDTSIDTLRRYVGARRTAYNKKHNTPPCFEEGVHFQRYGDGMPSP